MSQLTTFYKTMISVKESNFTTIIGKLNAQISSTKRNSPEKVQDIEVLQARIDDINYLMKAKKFNISLLKSVTFSCGSIYNNKQFLDISKDKINEIISAFSLKDKAIEELNKQAEIVERIKPLLENKNRN